MKTTVQILFISLLLLTLTSCGAKKSATTLEITSSALTMSNNGFSGGLVIMGKSGSESFSYPIAFSGSGNSSITLELPKQTTWTFTAIGWNGGANPFEGLVKCAVLSNVSLSNDAHTFNLNLTQQNCENLTSQFGNSVYYVPGTNFRAFSLATCGWLYTDNSATPVTAATSLNYCTTPTASFSPDFVRHAKSIRIEVPRLFNGQVSPGLSHCIGSGSNGVFNTPKRMPTKGLPVKISLYKETNCPADQEKFLVDYLFTNGIDQSGYNADFILGTNGGTTNLFLSVNEVRRGFSNFLGLVPDINCGGSSCMPIPSLAGDNRVITSGQEFVLMENVTSELCSNLTLTPTGFSGFSFNSSQDCRIDDEKKMIVRVHFSSLTSGSLTLGGPGFSGSLGVQSSPNYSLYRSGYELLGWPNFPVPSSDVKNSFSPMFDDYEHESRSSGALSRIRGMFLPGGPLSVFGSVTCAAGVNPERFVSFFEDGGLVTYRARLSDISDPIPKFICDDNTPDVLTCPVPNFTKRLHLSRFDQASQTYKTQGILKFHCTKKIGSIEKYEVDSEKTEKYLAYWNTEAAWSRMESYSLEQEFDASKNLIDVRHNFERIVKVTTNDAQASLMHFSAHKEGGNWDTHLMREQLHLGPSDIVYLDRHISGHPGTDPYEVFKDTYSSLLKSGSVSKDIEVAESPDKRFVVKAVVTGAACPRSIFLSIKDRNSVASADTTSLSVPCSTIMPSYKPEISVNNNGKAIVGLMVTHGTMNYEPSVYTYDGVWSSFVNPGGITEMISNPVIRVHMHSNNKAVSYWLQKPNSPTPQSLIQVSWTTLSSPNAPVVIDTDGTWDVTNFELTIDNLDRVWTFAVYFPSLDLAFARVFNSSFGAVAAFSVPGAVIPDFNSDLRASRGLTSSAKFFFKYFDGGFYRIKPFTFVESGGTITPTYGMDVVTNEQVSDPNIACTPRSPSTFTSPGSGCMLLQGAFINPVRPQVSLDLSSLAPTNFNNVFTSNFENLP